METRLITARCPQCKQTLKRVVNVTAVIGSETKKKQEMIKRHLRLDCFKELRG